MQMQWRSASMRMQWDVLLPLLLVFNERCWNLQAATLKQLCRGRCSSACLVCGPPVNSADCAPGRPMITAPWGGVLKLQSHCCGHSAALSAFVLRPFSH
jgi:hypothetical protein